MRQTSRPTPHRRAGPLFGAVLLVVTGTLAFTPAVPPVGAIDPTPAPSADPVLDPTPAPTPDPTADPTLAPTPDPTADPTPAPTPDPTADPTPAPTPDPCGSSLQERIDAAPSGAVLDLSGCTYAESAIIARPLTLRGAELAVPPGSPGIVVQADDVTLDGLRVSGSQATTFDALEVGISAVGTEADPIERLTITNSTVERFANAAIRLQLVADVAVTGNVLRDTARAGLEIRSGEDGVVAGNLVQQVGSAAASEPSDAYGIRLAQKDRASDPPTTAFVVVGNVVTDVPAGSAFATDGGRRILWTANTALRARSAFVVTGTEKRRAADNDLEGNTAYGWPGADWAFSSTFSTGGFIRDNTIAGWPAGREVRTAGVGDPAAAAVDLSVSGNAITADPAPAEDPAPFVPPQLPSPPAPGPDPQPTPEPSPEPTPEPSPDPSASPDPSPGPTPTPSPEPVRASLEMTTSAPVAGRHRIDPGAALAVTLAAVIDDPARASWLVLDLPPGWTVVDADAGVVDGASSTITWSTGDLPAGSEMAVTATLRAPAAETPGSGARDAPLEARLGHAGGTTATAASTVLVAPAIVVEHTVLAEVDGSPKGARYNAPDVNLGGLVSFDRIRVRFQVRNADLVDVAILPRLQVAVDGAPFADVPAGVESEPVVRLATEWRPDPRGRGTRPGPELEEIEVGQLRVPDVDNPTQRPTAGRRVMGADSGGAVTLAGDAYTEIEFAVKVSGAIAPRARLQFRLTDDGQPLDGAAVATAVAAAQVTVPLSPGQRDGIDVGPPVDVQPAALGDVDYPLLAPAAVTAAAWPEAGVTPRYRLAVAVPMAPQAPGAPAAPFLSPHTPDYSLVSDTCAACHRAHAAQGSVLLAEQAPQATMCFSCHDGSGSELDTKAQFTDPAVPPNDAATRSYYRHDADTVAPAPNAHSLTSDNEFGGVSNRHSVCADCHNSHNATTAAATQTTTGWTISGRAAAVSGVAVTNGAAGTAPTYAFLDGSVGSQPDREYQLCFKCHSGFTVLPSNDGRPPSQHALDKGIELNPENASYHPVQAPGRNTSTAMANSLAGSSPYKLWNFTTGSTVRCVNCHGDPRKADAAAPPDAGGDLAPHTSQNRGLLIQGYRDRVLKSPSEAYDAADAALCLVCHAEAPFVSQGSGATSFTRHASHLTGLANEGPGGTDIDTPGAGGGNAICAECHFRVHSTAQANNAGDQSNPGLVNFAPNVLPNNGVLRYERTPGGQPNCTLVCHGERHGGGGGGPGGN